MPSDKDQVNTASNTIHQRISELKKKTEADAQLQSLRNEAESAKNAVNDRQEELEGVAEEMEKLQADFTAKKINQAVAQQRMITLKQGQERVQKALEAAQAELKKKQAELMKNPDMTELQTLESSQHQGAAILQAMSTSGLTVEITADPKMKEFWEKRVLAGELNGVKFSKEPFSVSTESESIESALKIAAAAMLMAKEGGVNSLTVRDGTPAQRIYIAQQFLRAGLSNVKIIGGGNADKTWSAIFEAKQSLPKGTQKDDFTALYNKLGEQSATKHYTPASLQMTLITALTPVQFAAMLAKADAADNGTQNQMLGQLAQVLKDKPASEWEKYADCLSDDANRETLAQEASKQVKGWFNGSRLKAIEKMLQQPTVDVSDDRSSTTDDPNSRSGSPVPT
jgi:hypothetical protein